MRPIYLTAIVAMLLLCALALSGCKELQEIAQGAKSATHMQERREKRINRAIEMNEPTKRKY